VQEGGADVNEGVTSRTRVRAEQAISQPMNPPRRLTADALIPHPFPPLESYLRSPGSPEPPSSYSSSSTDCVAADGPNDADLWWSGKHNHPRRSRT
jgi:hypothetical protein